MRSEDKDVSAKNVGVGVKFPSSLNKERACILNKEKKTSVSLRVGSLYIYESNLLLPPLVTSV